MATFQPTCVVTMPTTDNALSAAKMVEPVPVVTQTPAFVVTNASTVAPESESRITASALQSAALAAIPTGSAPGLAIVNAESPEESVLKSGVPLVPTGLPTTILADDTPTEMDFAASQGNDDDASHPEGSWTTVSANRKPASTARPRTELITVGIQLPPGTLTPKLPLYDLLASIIAAANLSPKTSAEVTLQAKPAQSLVFLKTHSPLTAHLLLSLTNLELNDDIMKLKINDEERDVFPVVNESGVHVAGEQGGLLYATEVSLFVNEATGAERSQQNDSQVMVSSQVATAPAADVPVSCPPADDFEETHPGTSTDTEVLSDTEREVWPRNQTLFLISKYKELNNVGIKKGGFRTKKLMWRKLAEILNAEFSRHFTALQVENKWKSLERRYKKTKAKNNSSGHSRVSCDYESELAEVLEKQHHVTPTVLVTQGKVMVAENSLEQDTGTRCEPEEAAQLGRNKKRRRRETSAVSLLKIIADAEAAREKRHHERMALFKEFIAAIRSYKE
ncbi:hypothetical protein MTO96_039811 [Rhipicephalus appendiculatus]